MYSMCSYLDGQQGWNSVMEMGGDREMVKELKLSGKKMYRSGIKKVVGIGIKQT